VAEHSDPIIDALRAVDWDFSGADTLGGGHGLHPYPAKFPPQIPRTLIELLSQRGELVLDCFGGSGTTALEALLAGRRAASLDANPVGSLITRVKTRPLVPVEANALVELGRAVANLARQPGHASQRSLHHRLT
jgi:hypothetical protein